MERMVAGRHHHVMGVHCMVLIRVQPLPLAVSLALLVASSPRALTNHHLRHVLRRGGAAQLGEANSTCLGLLSSLEVSGNRAIPIVVILLGQELCGRKEEET